MDIISAEGIKKHLNNSEIFDISVFDSVTSTNALLKEQAFDGENEGAVIIADSQTNGRGRFSRKFHSPKNSGIYMSILLKPDLSTENSVLITAAAAAAVSLAAENLSGKKTQIKWVNDVLIKNKKICGILTEGGLNPKTGGFDWAVLGIGINAYAPKGGFSEEIKDIATCVFEKQAPDLRNRFIAEILNLFWDFYINLDKKTFFKPYKNRMVAIGKEINVIKNGDSQTATCLDLDSNCRMLVEYKNGEKELLCSGEISVRLT